MTSDVRRKAPESGQPRDCVRYLVVEPVPVSSASLTASKRLVRLQRQLFTHDAQLGHLTDQGEACPGPGLSSPFGADGPSRSVSCARRQHMLTLSRSRPPRSMPPQPVKRSSQSAASGSRTSNRAPVSRLRADSVPRCACTSPAAMASPRPEPLGSDESDRGTRSLEPR